MAVDIILTKYFNVEIHFEGPGSISGWAQDLGLEEAGIQLHTGAGP